ncbi:MAG TPA: ABC transporter substrate-binding protein [Solirubrobacteraceae bacterium]|nr:ABC transporter substrate-binding protein [Solirubrobacteraceae bacterium]
MRWVGPPRLRFAVLGCCAAAVALAGCGSTTTNNQAVTVDGKVLTIYASQPPGAQTAVDADVLDAEKLALHQAGSKSGKYTLQLRVVHEATVSAAARAAISDKTAIAYLGEIQPGTSGASTQINNELGLLQISPTDTAVYLTQPTPAVPGSPQHWFPAHGNFGRTFARVVPNTAKEATKIVSEMGSLHRTKLFVTSDAGSYGRSVALEVRKDATATGITVVSSAAGADAVFYAGEPGAAATNAVDAAAAASPRADLFVPSALYDEGWVHGLSGAAQQRLYVSAPGFLPGHYQGTGPQFVSAFRSAFHHRPQPQAVFGYAAMQALLAGLQRAGANANSRADVTKDVQGLNNQHSALGTYTLNGGDTNIAPFIFARPVAGTLVPRVAG